MASHGLFSQAESILKHVDAYLAGKDAPIPGSPLPGGLGSEDTEKRPEDSHVVLLCGEFASTKSQATYNYLQDGTYVSLRVIRPPPCGVLLRTWYSSPG